MRSETRRDMPGLPGISAHVSVPCRLRKAGQGSCQAGAWPEKFPRDWTLASRRQAFASSMEMARSCSKGIAVQIPHAIHCELRWMRRRRLATVGLEAGGAAIARGLRSLGYKVDIFETRQLSKFLRVRRNKTDLDDARGIAEAVRLGRSTLSRVHLKSLECQSLQSRLVFRRRVIKQRIATVNLLCSSLSFMGDGSSATMRLLICQRAPALKSPKSSVGNARPWSKTSPADPGLRKLENRASLFRCHAPRRSREQRDLPAIHGDPGHRPGLRADFLCRHRRSSSFSLHTEGRFICGARAQASQVRSATPPGANSKDGKSCHSSPSGPRRDRLHAKQ